MLDTSSSARAEDVITSLVKSLDGFACPPFQTAIPLPWPLKEWLAGGEPPPISRIDREREFKSMDVEVYWFAMRAIC